MLAVLGNSVAFAAGAPPDPVKLKQTVTTRGIGGSVVVKELDGTAVSGTLTAIHDDTFDVTPKKATQPITIPYAQVSKVRNGGLSTGAKVTIGVVIGVVAAVGIFALVFVKTFKL